MPPEHASKKVCIELCLLAQNSDALAILVASCLQTNGEKMFASQHASRRIFVRDFLRVFESFLEQSIIGGEELHRHAFYQHAFPFLILIATAPRRIIQCGARRPTNLA